MSVVVYNGIELKIVRVRRFHRQAVRTDDDTDRLYDKITLEVSCEFTPAGTAYTIGDDGSPVASDVEDGTTAVETNQAVKSALMAERKPLEVTIEGLGIPLLKSPNTDLSASIGVDAANGPKPLYCTVTAIKGTNNFSVEWGIETFLRECRSETDPTEMSPLLSHRWAMEHDVDDRFFTVRRIEGTAVFRSDILQFQGLTADHLRSQLFFPVPKKFRRESIRVKAHSSGLILSYTVIDRQAHRSLGKACPATKLRAVYSVDTTAGGVVNVGNVVVRAWGDTNTQRADLFLVCQQVVAAKLGNTETNGRVYQARVIEDLMEPYVEYHCTFQAKPTARKKKSGPFDAEELKLFEEEVGPWIKPNEEVSPLPAGEDGNTGDGTRGTWTGRLVAAALQSPCQPYQPTDPNAQTGTPLNPLTAEDYGDDDPPPDVEVEVVDDLEEEDTLWNEEATEPENPSWWSDYKIDVTYRRKHHRVQIPVARPDRSDGGPVTLTTTEEDEGLTPQPETTPVDDRAECEIVTLAAATTRRVVRWVAERTGDWPKLPSTDTGDPNDVLLRDRVTSAVPQPAADGTGQVYHVEGVYIYAMRKSVGAGDALPMGLLPMVKGALDDNELPADIWAAGVIGPGQDATTG